MEHAQWKPLGWLFYARTLWPRRGETSLVRQGWQAGILRIHTGEEDVQLLGQAAEDVR